MTAENKEKAEMPKKEKKTIKLHHVTKKLGSATTSLARKLKLKKRKKTPALEFPLVDSRLKHRLLAALSYLHILIIIPLIFGKDNSLIRYHIRQGTTLLGLWVVTLFLFWLPVVGWIALFLSLVFMVMGIVNVFWAKGRPLPLIGRFALR